MGRRSKQMRARCRRTEWGLHMVTVRQDDTIVYRWVYQSKGMADLVHVYMTENLRPYRSLKAQKRLFLGRWASPALVEELNRQGWWTERYEDVREVPVTSYGLSGDE